MIDRHMKLALASARAELLRISTLMNDDALRQDLDKVAALLHSLACQSDEIIAPGAPNS